MNIVNLFKTEDAKKIFPLQTIGSMAKRWGVKKQTVKNWSIRHEDFPKPIENFIDGDHFNYYTLHDVEEYERKRGLGKHSE